MRKHLIEVLLALAVLFTASKAFAGGAPDKTGPRPVPIDASRDVCAQCFMPVKGEGYSVEALFQDGTAEKFDDIGCLLKKTAESAVAPAARYVQDSQSRKWLAVEAAFYVSFPGIRTPMGYGIHAFETRSAADSFVKANPGAKSVALEELAATPMKMD